MNFELTAARMFFSAPLQLSHKSPDHPFRVCDADVRGLPFKRVAKTHRNRHVRVVIHVRERGLGLVPLCFVEVRFEILEDGVGVSYRWLSWQRASHFLGLAFPILNDTVARLLDPSPPICSCKERLIFCFFVVYNVMSVIRRTFHTSMPMRAVVLKYCLRARVITVNSAPAIHILPPCPHKA